MKSTKMTKMALRSYIGTEPDSKTVISSDKELIPHLNYFNYFHNRKEAIEYLEKYLKNKGKYLDRDLSKIPTSLGWIARMKTVGVTLPEKTETWFQNNLEKLPYNEVVVKMESLADPIDVRVIAEIEEKFDNGDTADFTYLRDYNLPNSAVNKIIKMFGGRLEEIKLIGKDEQVTEAYANVPQSRIDAEISGLNNLLEVFGVKNKTVAGRKSKEKSPYDIAKYMVLAKEDSALDIRSLPASRIVGATTAILYNTKYRYLQIFNAKNGENLSVKGKSILNHDPENSFGKLVKKPEQFVNEFRNKNLKKMMKVFDGLNTKAKPQVSSLISENHILLTAF